MDNCVYKINNDSSFDILTDGVRFIGEDRLLKVFTLLYKSLFYLEDFYYRNNKQLRIKTMCIINNYAEFLSSMPYYDNYDHLVTIRFKNGLKTILNKLFDKYLNITRTELNDMVIEDEYKFNLTYLGKWMETMETLVKQERDNKSKICVSELVDTDLVMSLVINVLLKTDKNLITSKFLIRSQYEIMANLIDEQCKYFSL
jgi:hypothetical protein